LPAARRRPLVAVAALVLLVEYATAVRLFTVPEPPAVYAWLARQPRSVVVELPVPRPDRLGWIHDGLYMYFSTDHWHRLVNGYSGFYPPSYLRLLETMRRFPDEASIEALRATGAEYVIVHGRFYERDDYTDIVMTLGQRADLTSMGRFPAAHGESRVYRLNPHSSARRP
jgi:hypothetical protein